MSIKQKIATLPDNWLWVDLDEVLLKVVGGGTPSKTNLSYWTGDIPWLTVKDMKTTRPSNTIDHISKEAVENSATNIIPADTLIIATRIGLGKVVRVPFPTAINQDLKGLFLSQYMDKSFVEYWLISIASHIERIGAGTTVKGIRLEQLHALKLPLPPQKVQRRIVEKIEELFSHIDAGVEGLKQTKTKLQQYRQSVLKDAVTGKLTEKWREKNAYKLEPADQLLECILAKRRENWEQEQLKDFEDEGKIPKNDKWKDNYVTPRESANIEGLPKGWVSAVTDQIFSFVTSGSRGWAKYYSENGVLFLRVGNLFHYNVELDLRKLQRVSPPDGAEGNRSRVQAGDILISITADVGMVGYVPDTFEEAYINQHVALARPVNKVMGKYLAWLLSGDFAKDQFKELQKGVTKAGLGLDDIRSINFGLPSLLEQKQIVFEIESRIAGLDRLAKEIDNKLQQASKLKAAILSKAFAGQLVPNESAQSALELLEKINAEKQQLVKEAKGKPKKEKKVSKGRKSLESLLKTIKEPVSPEELMQLAEFSLEEVEEFYIELATLSHQLEKVSPTKEQLKSWPYEKDASLKLKLKD